MITAKGARGKARRRPGVPGVLRAIRELHTETEALFDAVATRRPSTDDRRAQIISVSDRPAELRAEIWDPDRGDAVAVLDSVSPQELRAVASVVHRLAEVNRTRALRTSAPAQGDGEGGPESAGGP